MPRKKTAAKMGAKKTPVKKNKQGASARGTAKKKGPASRRKRGVQIPAARQSETRLSGSASQLVDTAMTVGLSRAEELLRQIREELLSW